MKQLTLPKLRSLRPPRGRRQLATLRDSSHLTRHPRDGWQPAQPYPMGHGTRRAFRALIRAICPPAPAPNTPYTVGRVELQVRRYMAYMHPLTARGLWLALHLLDWAPILLLKSRRRLYRMRRQRAVELLATLAHSRLQPLRMLATAVRGAILSAYFDQDEVHRALGYSPRPFMTERIALRRELVRFADAK